MVRVEGARILATLTRTTGSLQLAEDAVQDAVVSALEVWPRLGFPPNPGGWLMTAARRKAIDILRREANRPVKEAESTRLLEQLAADPGPVPESVVRDDLLRLLFTCCHPAMALEARVALALRTLCGLSTAEVARALLVPEPTMAKRLVRARQKIAAAAVPYRVPGADELPARLPAVCAVVHLVYTSGHAAAGDELLRVDLCDEGVRLARLLADLLPGEPTVQGLLALLLLTDARRGTRLDAGGEVVLLEHQDRARWDRAAIGEGLARLDDSLRRTEGWADPYQLQAAIAACHVRAPAAPDTDWAEIARLYGLLEDVHPNPVVRLNRAVAVAQAAGPEAGLALLDGSRPVPGHRWPATRGELLARAGRVEEALAELRAALRAGATGPERRHLERRIEELAGTGEGPGRARRGEDPLAGRPAGYRSAMSEPFPSPPSPNPPGPLEPPSPTPDPGPLGPPSPDPGPDIPPFPDPTGPALRVET